MSDTWVTIGKIGRPYGVKGGVHIQPSSQSPQDLSQLTHWQLRFPDGQLSSMRVDALRAHGAQGCVATLVDVTDRDQAAALTHAQIEVPRSQLPQLPEGDFYWVDLLRLPVVNTAGDVLGVVTDCMDNGAQTVLVVSDQHTYHIPFIWQDTVMSVDVGQQIQVDWPVEAAVSS